MASDNHPNGSLRIAPPSSGRAVSNPVCDGDNLSSAAMWLPSPPRSNQHIEQTQKQRNAPKSVGKLPERQKEAGLSFAAAAVGEERFNSGEYGFDAGKVFIFMNCQIG
jgi:hypothetical protein